MKKIMIVVLILMFLLNVAVLLSSLGNTAGAEKVAGMSGSVRIELKEVKPWFFVSLLKF
jgi:hypothetical protein